MSEIANTIQKYKSIIAGADRKMNTLLIRGRNSVNLIRSNLDLLNLDMNEDISNLDIDSAKVEMDELITTVEELNQQKERKQAAEKEIKKIKSELD